MAEAVATAVNLHPRVAQMRMRKIEQDPALLAAWRELLTELGPFTIITDLKKGPDGTTEVSVAPSASGAPRAANESPREYELQVEAARRNMRDSVAKFELTRAFCPKTIFGSGVFRVPRDLVADSVN